MTYLTHCRCRGLHLITLSDTHTHTHTHSRTSLDEGSARRRHLSDNTQHSQETDIYALGGIRTRNPTRPVTAGPRVSPRLLAYRRYKYLPSYWTVKILNAVHRNKKLLFRSWLNVLCVDSSRICWSSANFCIRCIPFRKAFLSEYNCTIFEAFTTVKIHFVTFCVRTLCCLICGYSLLEETYEACPESRDTSRVDR